MNSLERVKTAAKLGVPDRVPVGPYMGNHGARVAGVKLRDYYTNGKIMADAQYKAWEIYAQDIVVPQSDGYYIAQGFGSEVEFYEDSTPTLKKTAISELSQISQLSVPDPYNDGRMPVYLEAVHLLSEKMRGEVCVRATGTGPFSLAAHLMGTQNFLMNIAEAEMDEDAEAQKLLLELMDITTEALIQFSIAALKEGANIVQCGDSLASLDMISPNMYQKYVFPFEKKFFSAMKEYKEKYDVVTLLHICGDNTKVMDLLAQTGADILEVDYKIDLECYKKHIGDKVCLMGNLNPAGALLRGTPQQVADEADECLHKAASGGGFILGSGCEVVVDTPLDNMKMMVACAKNYKY